MVLVFGLVKDFIKSMYCILSFFWFIFVRLVWMVYFGMFLSLMDLYVELE